MYEDYVLSLQPFEGLPARLTTLFGFRLLGSALQRKRKKSKEKSRAADTFFCYFFLYSYQDFEATKKKVRLHTVFGAKP